MLTKHCTLAVSKGWTNQAGLSIEAVIEFREKSNKCIYAYKRDSY